MRVGWGPDGCINDALQAITGATSGNGRLNGSRGPDYVLSWEGHSLRFRPREGLGIEEVLSAELGEVMGVGEDIAVLVDDTPLTPLILSLVEGVSVGLTILVVKCSAQA